MIYINIFLGILYGIMAATFSSSAFYRLPRNIALNGYGPGGSKPFCSKCKHNLKFYEYYSVLSWIFCKNQCNYCKEPIDPTYKINEAIIILTSTYLIYLFGPSETYIILLLSTILLSIINAINISGQKVPNSLYTLLFFSGWIYNTYYYHEFIDWIANGLVFAIPTMFILQYENIHKHRDPIILLAITSAYISINQYLIYFYAIAAIILVPTIIAANITALRRKIKIFGDYNILASLSLSIAFTIAIVFKSYNLI